MSYFAKCEATSEASKFLVSEVIAADQEFVDTQPGFWVQTSYNTRGGVHYGQDGNPSGREQLRKNYAGIGYTYDSGRDAFIPPQPYPSWTMSDDTCLWNAPVDMPTTGGPFTWNEATLAWDAVQA
jgi:hypothetical protein